MGRSPLSKIPIARITIPFCLGIILGDYFPSVPILCTLLAAIAGCAISIAFRLITNTPEKRAQLKPFFSIPIFIVSAALGWASYTAHQPKVLNLSLINDNVAYGRIESISFKERSMLISLRLFSEHAQGSDVILTTRGCNYTLSEGDDIAFKAHLQKIPHSDIPEDTDFALIKKRKGIIYQQHVASKKIKKYGRHSSLQSILAKTRKRIENAINQTSLTEESKHFVIALLLGDRKYIDAQTRSQYAQAGISHVLALSGLHIGIVMTMIWLLLWPLDFYRLKKLRFILSVAIIIMYDLLTGLPPSVVRATVMIVFSFSTFIFGRKASVVNSLMAAALIILVFSPEALFNAGFQLSFATVLCIVTAAPLLTQLKIKKRWLRYAVTLIGTSSIAMGATIALTAYYFHTISWASVISNVLVLPVFPLFMALATLITMLACGGVNINILNQAADLLANYANYVAQRISNLPFSHTKEVYFSEYDVVIYFCAIFFLYHFLKQKHNRWAYMNLCVACCAIGVIVHTHTLNSFATSGCVVFNSYDCTPILLYQNGKAYYWTPDDESKFDAKNFRIQHSGFFAAHEIDQFTKAEDTSRISNAAFHAPYARIFNTTFLVAAHAPWKRIPNHGKRVNIDYCIVTKRFNGTVDDLVRLYHIRHLTVSGNMFEPNIPKIASKCAQFGIKFQNLREEPIVIEK